MRASAANPIKSDPLIKSTSSTITFADDRFVIFASFAVASAASYATKSRVMV
jgi:hypothetical protein